MFNEANIPKSAQTKTAIGENILFSTDGRRTKKTPEQKKAVQNSRKIILILIKTMSMAMSSWHELLREFTRFT